MLKLVNRDGIILDLSVDFPNLIETCHPTLINRPTRVVDGITHISIFGYPVLASVSSTARHSRQVLPILLKIASAKGLNRLPSYLKKAAVDPDTFEY